MIKAWNTGHPGVCTIHANNALNGLIRLEQLIHEAGVIPVPEVIADTVNVIIYMERNKNNRAGRQVKEILEVIGYDRFSQQYMTEIIEPMNIDFGNERRQMLYELMELN